MVLGDAAGNAMNIATLTGACAALTRADGAAFRFPGTAQVYDHCLAQFTDAHALARASLWAATAEAARGQAFHVLSDTTKIRTAGFAETLDPADALIAAIERQIAARVLPRP